MNQVMSLEYSVDALIEFLDYMSEKGLANKNTIQSRKAACTKVFGILDQGERSDVREIDLEQVAKRFANLRGTEYSPQSLQVYKSRVSTAVGDFIRFKEDPSSFKPSGSAKASPKSARASVKRQTSEEAVQKSATATPATGSAGGFGAAPAGSMNVPVPIRDGIIVQLMGLPFDLSKSEAEKISAVVKALGGVYGD